MGATSTEGSGPGASNKLTTRDLSILANGPSILLSGVATSVELENTSPSGVFAGTVVFQEALPGSGEANYVVILTARNGATTPYVSTMTDNAFEDFASFTFHTDAECDVMYIVAKIGMQPSIS